MIYTKLENPKNFEILGYDHLINRLKKKLYASRKMKAISSGFDKELLVQRIASIRKKLRTYEASAKVKKGYYA